MRQASFVLASVLLVAAGLAGASERVVVESGDGFELTATLWPNDEEAPGILLLHQCDGDRSMFEQLGAELAAAGFRVLAPDFRGLGESRSEKFDLEKAGGEADWERAREEFGADVEAAYRYLGGVIGVLGASCGGGEAIRLATAHPEIAAVALLSARLSSVEERDAMKLPNQQLLLITAKGDLGAARPAGNLGYRKRSASTMKLFEGSAHGSALLAEHPGLVREIVAWVGGVQEGPDDPTSLDSIASGPAPSPSPSPVTPAAARCPGPDCPGDSSQANGKPDLSGTYDGATLTPLVRPSEYGNKLYLTPEEAQRIAEEERLVLELRGQQSDPDREAPPEGGDSSAGAAGNVGGYNSFWIDRGDDVVLVDGKFRTSILIDPEDGRMPPMTPEAREARMERASSFRRSNEGRAWWVFEDVVPGPYDNMEQRGTAERCLLGFTGATPSFPALYNNFKRIVQTEDHVMILVEMNHDARIVRLGGEHPPDDIQTWLGDSIGWWDGDTLVVESKNFRPGVQGRGGSENMTVTERFSRQPDGNLLYRFTVDDPTVWTAPWTGEYVWKATDERVYEYACHEGNYALGGIMRGARLLEKEAMKELEAKERPD